MTPDGWCVVSLEATGSADEAMEPLGQAGRARMDFQVEAEDEVEDGVEPETEDSGMGPLAVPNDRTMRAGD